MAGTKKSLKPCKLLCIFCYKPIVKCNNDQSNYGEVGGNVGPSTIADKLKLCDKFYHQLLQNDTRSCAIMKNKNTGSNEIEGEEKEEVSHDEGQQTTSLFNPDKNGICNDCFYAVATYSKLFEKFEKVQRRLRWQVDKLFKVMKYAGKIPSRVQGFQDNLTGDDSEKSVVEFRKKIYKTCRQKLKSYEDQGNVNDSVNNSQDQSIDAPQSSIISNNNHIAAKTRKLSLEHLTASTSTIIESVASRIGNACASADTPTIYKCSICCGKFHSLESLTSHATTIHWAHEKEPIDVNATKCKNDDKETGVECKVDIADGSKQEQMELDNFLETSKLSDVDQPDRPSSGGVSCSDSDPVVRENYPKLRKIAKSLRSHADLSKPAQMHDASFSNRMENRSPEKRDRTPTSKNQLKDQAACCSTICEKCRKCFTAGTMLEAKSLLVQHLANNMCHGCPISRAYTCRFCNKSFNRPSSLKCHITKMHSRNKRRRFSCSHCKRWFSRENILFNHFKTMHQNQVRLLQVRSQRPENETDNNDIESNTEKRIDGDIPV